MRRSAVSVLLVHLLFAGYLSAQSDRGSIHGTVKDPSGAYHVAAKAEQQKAEGLAAMNFGGAEKPVARVVSTASGNIDSTGAEVTAVSIGEGFRFGDGLLTIASGLEPT